MTSSDIPALPVYGFDPHSLSGLLSLIITVVLPILVGLVTKRSTSSSTKALLLLVFAAVKAFLEAWAQATNTGVGFAFVPTAISVVVNFVIAGAVYRHLWRPTGVAAAVQDALVKDRAPTSYTD